MIYFLDFEDSFSFNILSELYSLEFKDIKIIKKEKLEVFLQKIDTSKNHTLILGPGPGHPDQYPNLISFIFKELSRKSKISFLGICLGHQLISCSLKGKVEVSNKPKHGQSVALKLTKDWREFFGISKNSIQVQRYNSLAVSAEFKHNLIFDQLTIGNEIMLMKGMKFISFQFHPESIGTEYSSQLLGGAMNYLLNT